MMKTLKTKTENTAADAYLKATNILKNFSPKENENDWFSNENYLKELNEEVGRKLE